MTVCKEVMYKSYKAVALTSKEVELIISIDFGPRILSFKSLKNGMNFMKNFDDQLADFKKDEWQSYGGHRLWIAPEVYPDTYYPDVDKVEYNFDENEQLHLLCETEKTSKLQKEFVISIESERLVKIVQYIYNRKESESAYFAPWSLTVMAEGGRLVVPQEPFVPHGEKEGESFLPARPLVLWKFTNMADPRFTFGTNYVQMRQDDSFPTKQKIGMCNTLGYSMYTLGNETMVKWFDYKEDVEYPDMGCNCEFFTMPGFLEMEALGPMKVIAPGKCAELVEYWEILDFPLPEDDAEIAKVMDGVII